MKIRFLFTSILIAMCFTGCDRKRESVVTTEAVKKPALIDGTTEKVNFYPYYNPHFSHYERKSDFPFLTIEEFDAPPGFAEEKYVPGKYVVKGSYNIHRTNFPGATIKFGVMGRFSRDSEFTHDTLQIPAGQATGTFELSLGIRAWNSAKTGTNQFPFVELEMPFSSRTSKQVIPDSEKLFLRVKTNAPAQGKL